MPMVMEKKDWMQTVANVGAADGVWFENVAGNAGSISVSLPEGGRYQVILVKVDSLPTKTLQPRKSSSVAGDCKNRVMKIGSMRGEVVLPDNFDQVFEGLDDQVASMFSGVSA